jgi:hypothetical protein
MSIYINGTLGENQIIWRSIVDKYVYIFHKNAIFTPVQTKLNL